MIALIFQNAIIKQNILRVMMKLINKKILVVEDEEIARDVLAMILRKHFTDVIVAKDGKQGLAYVQENQPDLIVADLAMPVLDGFVMIDQLEQMASEIPVVIVTAYREEAAKFSKYPVLFKPVNRGVVIDKIKDVLGVS
jgi:CheY-like chemotaxis protein